MEVGLWGRRWRIIPAITPVSARIVLVLLKSKHTLDGWMEAEFRQVEDYLHAVVPRICAGLHLVRRGTDAVLFVRSSNSSF